jgi:hypothetical protein
LLLLVVILLAVLQGMTMHYLHGTLLLIGSLALSLLLPAWMAWLLVPFWRKTSPSIGRVISGLLAGIVLLDMVVISLQIGPYAVVLLPLFILALLLQRVIPAT